jgi:hypothetical protein
MWSIFVPPFLWIFLGGPYLEALIGNGAINASPSAVTAAIVGVIVNLAFWLALHVMFATVQTHYVRYNVARWFVRHISCSPRSGSESGKPYSPARNQVTTVQTASAIARFQPTSSPSVNSRSAPQRAGWM